MTSPTPPTDGPHGSTVGGVRRLVQDVAAEGVRTGTAAARRVADTDIVRWLTAAAAIVDVRIRRAALLTPATADAKPGKLSGEQVEVFAGHLCELYAAALVADVNHPERQSQYRGSGGSGAGAVLLDRFWHELDELRDDIDASLAPDGTDDDGNSAGTAAAIFPASRFPRGFGF